MRITGGDLGGRRIKAPRGDVRPTQDRVREALFSMLVERVPGCRFLDLFAGSGIVGLEAWSRGAAYVLWVESVRQTRLQLERTVASLCDDGARVIGGDVLRVLSRLGMETPFDVIFADPPYDFDDRAAVRPPGGSAWARLLDGVRESGLLAADGLLVIETDRPVELAPGWQLLKERTYGKTRLMLLYQ